MEVTRKGCLTVHKPDCLKCGHLVPFVAEKEDCTAENGNDMCPAQAVQIVIGANVTRAVASIVKAMKANDPKLLADKMTKLSTYHDSVQSQVMTEVKRVMAHSHDGSAPLHHHEGGTVSVRGSIEPPPEDDDETPPPLPDTPTAQT